MQDLINKKQALGITILKEMVLPPEGNQVSKYNTEINFADDVQQSDF